MKKLFIILGALFLVLAVAVWVLIHYAVPAFFYPKAGNMPPIVSETTAQLLTQLQSTLEKRAPEVLKSLQPGLSDQQISDLEAKGGFTLSPDLREFYRWHNGSNRETNVDFIPIHRFVPLEEIVSERTLLTSETNKPSVVQSSAYSLFAGHRKNWVQILDDGAGDGYYFDSDRLGHGGDIFYNFAETRTYQFFPSFRNFLKGVIECYDQQIFTTKDNGKSLDEDFTRATTVWNKLGVSDEKN
jgi:cell wall assembly regulator SMI1